MTSINFNEYTAAAGLFANKRCEHELEHYLIGIGSEIGEIGSCLKKQIAYGKEVDRVNLGEELGDMFWFMSQFMALYRNIKSNNGADCLPGYFAIPDNFHEQGAYNHYTLYPGDIMIAYEVWKSMFRNMANMLMNLDYGTRDDIVVDYFNTIRNNILSLAAIYNLDTDAILKANIDKLTQRYGGTVYDQNKALFRNLGVEYKALGDTLK